MLAWIVAVFLMSCTVMFSEANGEFIHEKADFTSRHQNLARVVIFMIGVLALCTARYL